MTTTIDVAKIIKQRLIARDLRQVDIARSLGISRAAVAQYVSGKQRSRRFDAWVLCFLDLDLVVLRAEMLAHERALVAACLEVTEQMMIQGDAYSE